MIKDNTVRFSYYKNEELWYELQHSGNMTFLFPVPIDDVGTATLLAEDKAILFMRYIRKHLKVVDNIPESV